LRPTEEIVAVAERLAESFREDEVTYIDEACEVLDELVAAPPEKAIVALGELDDDELFSMVAVMLLELARMRGRPNAAARWARRPGCPR
jgi:hypothetical protein